MQYVNQLDYPHVKYNHNMAHGGPPEGRDTVRTSGCGLCCASMVVDQLTDRSLPVEECVRLSEDNGASRGIGTNMKVLGTVIAARYELDFSYTNEVEEAIAHLQKGGRVVALVAGSREGYVGLFTKSEHYILLISYDGEEFCILDPSMTDTKFTEEGREGRVRVEKPFVYASRREVELATEAESRRYYLFSRKTNKSATEA